MASSSCYVQWSLLYVLESKISLSHCTWFINWLIPKQVSITNTLVSHKYITISDDRFTAGQPEGNRVVKLFVCAQYSKYLRLVRKRSTSKLNVALYNHNQWIIYWNCPNNITIQSGTEKVSVEFEPECKVWHVSWKKWSALYIAWPAILILLPMYSSAHPSQTCL